MIHDLPPHRLRWQITQSSIELHADGNRHLAATDPDRRDLLLSCGAALHHLHRSRSPPSTCPYACTGCPIPRTSGHLPTIEILPSATDPADTDSADRADAALADSIDRRRTERRRMATARYRRGTWPHSASRRPASARGWSRSPTPPFGIGSLPPSPRPPTTRTTPGLRSRSAPGKAIGW